MKLCSPLSVMKNNSMPTAVQSGFFALSSFIKPNMQSKKCLQLTALLVMGSLLSACGSDSSASNSDNTAPVVTLSGNDSVELGQGRDYLEYGATVTDNRDSDLDFDIDIVAGESNICSDIIWNDSEDENYSEDCVGDIFTVSYSATDSAGNVSESVERTITIVEARPFIFTYQTTEDGEEFTPNIDPDDYDYDFTIDWGDGSTDENVDYEILHTYDTAGTYTVTINGDFPTFTTEGSYEENYQSVEQWGDIKWQYVEAFLQNAFNLEGNATDTPDLRLVDSLSYFFDHAESFNGDISLWQVGHITDMSYVFKAAYIFNQDIGDWDMSSATTMVEMLRGALIFNQDISGWDVSSVSSMEATFASAEVFNQDISGWDVSKVETFERTFSSAGIFDQDISGWDFSSATEFFFMFKGVTLSTENYDKLLNSFVEQDVAAENILFSGGYSVPSDASLDARETLTNDKGWTFYYDY